jgi:excisionase family DNA binding protein
MKYPERLERVGASADVRRPPSPTLADLATLPEVVRSLQTRVAELEARAAEPDDGQLLDTKTAATLLGMSASAVRQAAYRGALPSLRIGRRLRFRRSQLSALR